MNNNEKGFATIFSLSLSLIFISFIGAFLISASFIKYKYIAENAAEKAALIALSTQNCLKAEDIALKNNAIIINCELSQDSAHVETYVSFNNSQRTILQKFGFQNEGIIGIARSGW